MEKGTTPSFQRYDFDADGHEELLVSTSGLHVGVAPAAGGSLFHLDLVDYDFCLSNTMSRVFEAYHDEFRRASSRHEDDGHPESIHERMVVKEEGLMDILTYDRYPRYSFLDHVFHAPVGAEDLMHNNYEEAGDFVTGAYEVSEVSRTKDAVAISLFREGTILIGSKRISLGIKKIYTMKEGSPSAAVRYVLVGREDKECSFFFGVENNFTLLAGDDPLRYLLAGDDSRRAMNSQGETQSADHFSIVDEFSGFKVEFHLSRAARLAYYGVQTASNSEGGLERTYQGTCIVSLFPVTLREGVEYEVELSMTVSSFGKR